jgi:hypothetical protein
MKLLNLSNYFFFTFLLFFFNNVHSQDAVDICEKKDLKDNKSINTNKIVQEKKIGPSSQNIFSENDQNIIESENSVKDKQALYGVFDPEQNNFDLNMWSNSDGTKVEETIKRINKINLSMPAEDLFVNLIMTYAYAPKNISEDSFLDLKIDWLIKNKKDNLLEEFLNKNKNENFSNKKKIIQYLVDKSISKANLKDGCKKAEFISKEIKDAYLEKFKIYCLIFNNKKNEAQLLFDILKEQKLSEKFFNEKINFLLGIEETPNKKIKDDNLLNFYLSSITVTDFKYEPESTTDKFIWEYLNSANLVQIDNVENKEKIKKLEMAANNNDLDKRKIFEIYKKIPFDLNSLINAEGIYQSLEEIDSRALIYQRYLLSDNIEYKIKLLFLLKDLFKKEDLFNVFQELMSSELKKIDKEKIPEVYVQAVNNNIVSDIEYKLGKIKYDDKILHRSRVLRYYTEEGTPIQKSQKDLNNVYKKIKRNKNYFLSAKDLSLIESLLSDGFKIPKEIKYEEAAERYSVPSNLLDLLKNKELGLLCLKFVEIFGEDEISNLDPETIYFVTNILNKAKLVKFRNKVIISALPKRN